MTIAEIVGAIRKSDIGNIMYKVKPTGNFLGVYGLKHRPKDIEFLESGGLEDIDNADTIKKSYTLFRKTIPKDFAMLSMPKYWIKNNDKSYPINQYYMLDIDIYTYLLVAEGIRSENLPINSTNFNNLFYYDGRFVDYTNILIENMPKYSFILGDKSNMLPYIYKKQTTALFSESCVEDFLINSCCYDDQQVISAFNEIKIFSSIKEEI